MGKEFLKEYVSKVIHQSLTCHNIHFSSWPSTEKELIFIDRKALAKQGDNSLGHVGSIRPSVHPSVLLSVCVFVCLSALSQLNRLTFDLDFWYGCRP